MHNLANRYHDQKSTRILFLSFSRKFHPSKIAYAVASPLNCGSCIQTILDPGLWSQHSNLSKTLV